MLIDAQKPQAGRTLSHLVFLARQTWHAFRLLLRGYRASEEILGRFRDVLLESGVRFGSAGFG